VINIKAVKWTACPCILPQIAYAVARTFDKDACPCHLHSFPPLLAGLPDEVANQVE